MRYAARDLLSLPGLLSLARLPLAACFPLFVAQPLAAFMTLLAAGSTDMLDGWYARRHGQTSVTGAAIDPVTDKLFVLTVAVTLVLTQRLSLLEVLLLSTRELAELPLVFWFLLKRRAEQPRSNVTGKIATCCQFAAVVSALFQTRLTPVLVGVAAAAGLVAGAVYWRRGFSEEARASLPRSSAPT